MPYKSRKHTYPKKEIDVLFRDSMYAKCNISLLRLTADDIVNYKLKLLKNKNKKLKKYGIISKDNNTLKDNKTSKSDKCLKDDKKSNDVKTAKDDKKSKDDKASKDNISIDDEPPKKKQKVSTDGMDILKLVLSREGETQTFKSQFKSSLNPDKGIASKSTEEIPIIIDCEESPDSSAKNVKPRLWVKDIKKLTDAEGYIRWMKSYNYDPKSEHPTNELNKVAVVKLPTSIPKVSGAKHALNGKKYVRGHLIKIEKLYQKYFTKSIQDTIVIIANILNIISMSNKHHKARMDESFKKRSEAEKLKERCDANRLHGRHKKVLETKLKTNFITVVSSFETSEFESAFQMFFLSILTVLRVLDQPKFKKGSIFKNLVLLLWNSLKNSEYDHPRVFSLFRSKTFRPDCIDLISLIEDSRDIDAGITDRMSLFFVSTVNSRKYFQGVIDAITGDSNEDLALLIDNATFQCSINSTFKDPVDSPTAQYLNDKIPATVTIPSPINSEDIVQHWFLAKNPDGTYQQIPVINGIKAQTIGNTAVKPSIVTSQPLNNFYQSFSSSLQNKTYEPSTSKLTTNTCFVVAPTINATSLMQVKGPSSLVQVKGPSSLVQVRCPGSMVRVRGTFSNSATSIPATTTFVTFRPSIQNSIAVTNNSIHKAEGGTIVVGNKQYQLVKAPSGQMKAVANGTNTIVKPQLSAITNCYARNCNNIATIMCSSCTSVKYCSHNCQRLDWYDNHINDCDQLLKKK